MSGEQFSASVSGDDQSEVIAFLSNPSSFPRDVSTVERRDTHGAIVFLAGPDAFKIKRAVRYSYLDFSTLQQRRNVIGREFEINRTFAPELYLGIVPITREDDGALAIDGAGVPVEWALKMRRFDENDLLSAIAARGELTRVLCRQVADAVHAAHVRARASPVTDAAFQYRAILTDVVAALDAEPGILNEGSAQLFSEKTSCAIENARDVLQWRAEQGFVKRCHGDLHLTNIVVWRDEPLLFDAIEFDEAIATVDTLYDLAFLLMDLEHRKLRVEANAILNRYLWRSNAALDLEGLSALPAFLALRAGVRAMVSAQRARQLEGEAHHSAVSAARAYLSTALRLLEPRPPCLISVGGLSGTGKSTLAAALAPQLGRGPGAVHLRSDLLRKTLFGVRDTDRLPADAYGRDVTDRVYALLAEKAGCALRAGQAVVTDAVYADPRERAAIEDVARRCGVGFLGFWLDAPPELLKVRVDARRGDASDATSAVVEQQLGYDVGNLNWNRMDASGTVENTLKSVSELLRTRQFLS